MINLPELSKQIYDKNIKKLYIFTGVESLLMDVYINRLVSSSELSLTRLDTILTVFSKLQNKSIFESEKCFVIREDKEYLKQESMWEKLITESAQGNNIVIFIYEKIDARSKFYKAHADNLVEFERLSEEVLCRHISKDTNLSNFSAKKLATMCALDYGRILLEIDKIKTLSNCLSTNIEAAFQEAISEKLIYDPPGDIIFAFVNAVLVRDIKNAYKFLSQLKLRGESPLGAITMLYNNFRSMLLVQSLENNPNIAETSGLTPWQIIMIKEKKGKYSTSDLVRALRIIRETEKGIKIGNLDIEISIDHILIKIL